MFVCVCVCECVCMCVMCVCEREREKWGKSVYERDHITDTWTMRKLGRDVDVRCECECV